MRKHLVTQFDKSNLSACTVVNKSALEKKQLEILKNLNKLSRSLEKLFAVSLAAFIQLNFGSKIFNRTREWTSWDMFIHDDQALKWANLRNGEIFAVIKARRRRHFELLNVFINDRLEIDWIVRDNNSNFWML